MSRLPVFSLQEKSYIKGTSDFLGLGHFTTRYITERNYPSRQGPSYQNDRDLVELVDPNWPDLGSKWLYSVPWGFRRLLHFAQVIITLSYSMNIFFFKDLRKRECVHACVGLVGQERDKQTPCWAYMRFDLRTQRSIPQLESRVGCPINWATRGPLLNTFEFMSYSLGSGTYIFLSFYFNFS